MTREELKKQLELTNEQYSSLELGNYIELRLIADALIGINETLNADGPYTLTDRISSIAANIEDLKDVMAKEFLNLTSRI